MCRCVTAGCSPFHKDGVSLFSFTKDAGLRKMWADPVKRTRDKWEPTEHSYLCIASTLNSDSCFQPGNKLSGAMRLGKRKPLLIKG